MRCSAILSLLTSSFITLKPENTVLCIPRNVSVLLSVFSLSVSLYLRVSPVDTQKHVCLFVLLPPGHSASATVKSLGWEGHMGVGTDPAAPHLCCDLYPGACHFWASLSCSEQWGLTMPIMRTLQDSCELMEVPGTREGSAMLSQIWLWSSFSKRDLACSDTGLHYLPLCLFFRHSAWLAGS